MFHHFKHRLAAPGWVLTAAGIVGDTLSHHALTILSGVAILVGIAYHLVLIRLAVAKHRLEVADIERRRYPWNGYPFFGPESRN